MLCRAALIPGLRQVEAYVLILQMDNIKSKKIQEKV
jgi:hypothetical protein